MRLIDANALKNEMSEENPYIHLGPFGYCACSPKTDGELVFKREEVLRAIDSAPTVDAVEVVHAYWHIDDYDSGEPDGYAAFIEVHCSKCGYELGAESGQYGWDYGDPFPLNYCPNCGARMDGERKVVTK